MGDPAHRRRKSDHNLGNALDLTHDPAGGFHAGRLAEELVRQSRGNPGSRLLYVIFDRRIASAARQWIWRPYVGPNPHTTHAHFSIRPSQRGNVRPWRLS